MSKSIIFLVKSFLGNFHRHLVIFIWFTLSVASVVVFLEQPFGGLCSRTVPTSNSLIIATLFAHSGVRLDKGGLLALKYSSWLVKTQTRSREFLFYECRCVLNVVSSKAIIYRVENLCNYLLMSFANCRASIFKIDEETKEFGIQAFRKKMINEYIFSSAIISSCLVGTFWQTLTRSPVSRFVSPYIFYNTQTSFSLTLSLISFSVIDLSMWERAFLRGRMVSSKMHHILKTILNIWPNMFVFGPIGFKNIYTRQTSIVL